jgi:hypothetical protein
MMVSDVACPLAQARVECMRNLTGEELILATPPEWGTPGMWDLPRGVGGQVRAFPPSLSSIVYLVTRGAGSCAHTGVELSPRWWRRW